MKVVVNLACVIAVLSITSLASLSHSIPSQDEANCDLASVIDPNCFHPRKEAVVRVMLGSYGSIFKPEDLKRIGAFFKTRFEESTGGALKLEIVDQAVVPLKAQHRDFSEFEKHMGPPARRTPERLTRVWYYYNKKLEEIAVEVREEFLKEHANTIRQVDALLVLSEPQFEGLGFAYGGVALVKQPVEIGLIGGGETLFETDPKIVDELVHELGHVLGLDHAAKHCDDKTKTWREIRACCETSPSGSDVMSYCRERRDVNESFFYPFSECSKKFLRETTLPNLLSGGARVFQPEACR